MDSTTLLVAFIIAVALAFDYINGFHDAANSIATVVATRVLSPFHAVLMAAFFNFVSAFTLGTAVASTIGKGLIDVSVVTPYVVLGGLVGAIAWDLITWWWGLPTSSSHALIGGYAGAAMAKVGMTQGFANSFSALQPAGWTKTLVFIFIAPLIGVALAWLFMVIIHWTARGASPQTMDGVFRKLQLVSSAFFSFAHGSNDAQKTMGIIASVMFAGGWIPTLRIDTWVIFAAHAAIALGTLSGGWRIVRTMGSRLTRLKPRSGFSAETAAAVSVLLSSELGIPVSTTHVIGGAIVGVGSIQRVKAVRWGLAQNIVWAWVMTIPAAALVGGVSMLVIRLFTDRI